MRIKYFDPTNNLGKLIDLPDAIDCIEIEIGRGRIGPYHNVNLKVNVNNDAVIVHANDQRVAMYEYNQILSEAQVDGVQIPFTP